MKNYLVVALIALSSQVFGSDVDQLVGVYRNNSCDQIEITKSETGLVAITSLKNFRCGNFFKAIPKPAVFNLEEVAGSHFPTFKPALQTKGVNVLNLQDSILQINVVTTGRFLTVKRNNQNPITFKLQ